MNRSNTDEGLEPAAIDDRTGSREPSSCEGGGHA
jgi:hypothetical protein